MNFENATRLAVISPVAAGCAWAGLMFTSWKIEAGQPDAGLGTALAVWALGVLGLVGLGILLIPLTIGLVTRSDTTRLAAGWVGSLVAALGGAFWLFTGLGDDLDLSLGLLGYASAAALFVPLVVTGWASRQETEITAHAVSDHSPRP